MSLERRHFKPSRGLVAALVLAPLLATASVAAAPRAKGIYGGVIVVGRGVAGARPTRIEDGERVYRITERYLGRTVWTEFYVEHFGPKASVYGFDLLFPLTR